MKFGYFTLTDNPPAYGANRRDPNRFLLDVVEECVEAEAMGYHSAWVPEHHFGRFGVLPSPTMFLAHIANRTRTLKLGRPQSCCRSTTRSGWSRSSTCSTF